MNTWSPAGPAHRAHMGPGKSPTATASASWTTSAGRREKVPGCGSFRPTRGGDRRPLADEKIQPFAHAAQ